MKQLIKNTATLFILLIISGCSVSHFAVRPSNIEGVDLKNSKLYVYSFLDLRENYFGPKLISEFSKQISSELNNSGVSTKILTFKNTETGKYYINTDAGAIVPVQTVINSNKTDEQLYGAENRLIIFPSKASFEQARIDYEIRWELVDVKSGQVIWSTMSEGFHMNAWVPDEDPQPRAKKIVDAIIKEMQRNKII